MNKNEYDETFNKEPLSTDKTKRENAFEKAHQIRQFEIELYWKRTTYFWTILAAILAGYFLLLSTENEKIPHKDLYLTIVASIGFVFSFAWMLVAKGSKFWQENWENHIDLLEDDFTGSLYKTVIEDKNKKNNIFSTSAPYSVTKINHCVSVFLIIVCFVFMVIPFLGDIAKAIDFYNVIFPGFIIKTTLEILIVLCALGFIVYMVKNTTSKFKHNGAKKEVHIIKRETKMEE